MNVIDRIPTDSRVHAVTSVDDELFVLLDRDVDQVAVYSINDYQLLRHLSVPGLKPNKCNDMTSCVRNKCLYISDSPNSCVHRYQLTNKRKWGAESHISRWQLPYRPCDLSVTPRCNLLVRCWGEADKHNKLVELSADSGRCVREITLQSDMKYPSHGVQLTTGRLVVCHGVGLRNLHRVCLVDDDGEVAQSYGGQCGSGDGQLHNPCYLAVDQDSQCVIVADSYNHRITLLTPTLQFVRHVTTKKYIIHKHSNPCRLHLHQATRRLFIAKGTSYVPVLQM